MHPCADAFSDDEEAGRRCQQFTTDHKYYVANLALKAAEDGLVIDAVDLLGTPVSTTTASAAKPMKK